MNPSEAASVLGAVGSIVFELISACVNGQEWESRIQVTQGSNGAP